jgi:acetoin utilization protein AcuB
LGHAESGNAKLSRPLREGTRVKTIPLVKSVMTPFPYSIDASATVVEAQSMMRECDIRHLPVEQDHVLVGVVSDRDITRALDPTLGLPFPRELRVRDVMVPEPYVVDLHEPLDRVLLTLAERHIGCALVLREGRLVGIFTTTDGCRVFGEELRKLRGPDGTEAA